MRLSIRRRLTGITVIAVLLSLPLLGLYISAAFRSATTQAFDDRLQVYAYTLAGLLHVNDDGGIAFSRPPGELRFDQVFSGWYWQVDSSSRIVGTSRSLWDQKLQLAIPDPAQTEQMVQIAGPRGEPLHGRRLLIQLDAAHEVWLTVVGPLADIDDAVGAFNGVLLRSLGPLGLILVLALVAQIRWGLAPLRSMISGLRRVRSGEAPRLDTALPSDLQQVADAMNEVLSHQEDLLVRGRAVAGNLAHALKTPLSSLRLRVAMEPVDRDGLRDDLDRVQQIVDHHLTRASAAGLAGGRFRRTRILTSLQPVFAALHAMQGARMPQLDVDIDAALEVAIDPQDLQELAGNLLDNAAKWAAGRVAIRARAQGAHVDLEIDDDGPGIAEQDRALAAGRGTRFDEQRPGSGLGLAIVGDIARLYDVEVQLGHSRLGGLCARLRFPAPH